MSNTLGHQLKDAGETGVGPMQGYCGGYRSEGQAEGAGLTTANRRLRGLLEACNYKELQ